MDNEQQTLATELLREVKAQTKRWFITAVIELGIIVILIVAFFWYMSLPTEDALINNESGNANYIGRDLNGGLYNGDDPTYPENR